MGVADIKNLSGRFSGKPADGKAPIKLKVAGLISDYAHGLFFVVRQHKDGKISIEPPGGALEADETPRRGLRREIGEELGPFLMASIDDQPLGKIRDILRKDGKPQPRLTEYFKCQTVVGFAYNALPDEHLMVICVPSSHFEDGETSLTHGKSFNRLKASAIKIAQAELSRKGIEHSGPIEFRLPSKVYKGYFESRHPAPV